jgi:hypothetical protein
MPPCRGSSRWLPKIPTPKLTIHHYKIRARAHSSTHNLLEQSTSHLSCVFLVLVLVVVESKAKLSRKACLLGRRESSWYEYYYEEFFQVQAFIS